MDQGALRLLAFAAEPLDFAGGEVVFRRGEPATAGFLIVSGRIAWIGADEAAGTPRTVGPGVLIGEHALLAETVRPVTARAEAPTSALKITRSLFTRVLQEYPENAAVIRRFWAKRLHDRLSRIKA